MSGTPIVWNASALSPQISPLTLPVKPPASLVRENVTSIAQLPERPSLVVKMNPPTSVPSNVKACSAEVSRGDRPLFRGLFGFIVNV